MRHGLAIIFILLGQLAPAPGVRRGLASSSTPKKNRRRRNRFLSSAAHTIRQDYQNVVQHPVLKKWLYLPEASENFESDAQVIVEAIRMNDPRFGVEPKEKIPKKKKIKSSVQPNS